MSNWLIPYPQTCSDCPDRGELRLWSPHLDRYVTLEGEVNGRKHWDPDLGEFEFKNLCWPTRCKPCNARAQIFKRARKSITKLDNIRAFADSWASDYGHKDHWKYLKFVTLTWENPLVDSPQPDLKRARKWLRRKRDKIADKLQVIAGTDVLECVTNQVGDKFHHHVHSHGIWVMPYHPIEHIGSVMKKYVGRDQCRAIKPLVIDGEHGKYTMPALAQARNYLIKYLSKEPGTRRSLWGMARGKPDFDTWYPPMERIYGAYHYLLEEEKIESV